MMDEQRTTQHDDDLEACYAPWLGTAKAYAVTGIPLGRLLWEANRVLPDVLAEYRAEGGDLAARVEYAVRRRIIDYIIDPDCPYAVPVEVRDLVRFLQGELRSYAQENGQVPTVDELAGWIELRQEHRVVQAFQEKRQRQAEDAEIAELARLVEGLLPDRDVLARYSGARR